MCGSLNSNFTRISYTMRSNCVYEYICLCIVERFLRAFDTMLWRPANVLIFRAAVRAFSGLWMVFGRLEVFNARVNQENYSTIERIYGRMARAGNWCVPRHSLSLSTSARNFEVVINLKSKMYNYSKCMFYCYTVLYILNIAFKGIFNYINLNL